MEAIAGIFVFGIYFLIFLFVIITSLVSSVIYSAAVGAIPLMCGLIKKKKALAWIGFAVCFAIYWCNGFLLAQIASIVFTYFIIKDEKKEIAESDEKKIEE